MKSILHKMELKDLPNDGLRDLARAIGINKVKEILVKMPGLSVHFPKRFHKDLDNDYITKNFNGSNVEAMAEKLGFSERTIFRRIKSLGLRPDKQS